jgi:hypothetical protein
MYVYERVLGYSAAWAFSKEGRAGHGLKGPLGSSLLPSVALWHTHSTSPSTSPLLGVTFTHSVAHVLGFKTSFHVVQSHRSGLW